MSAASRRWCSRRSYWTGGAFHIRHQEWPTTARPADVVWPAVCSSTKRSLSGECAWVFDLGGAVARLFLSEDGVAKASFAAADADFLDAAEQTLRSLLPPDAEALVSEDEGLVPVTFWSYGVHSSTRRRLPTALWSEIAPNYAPATRSRLSALLEHPEGRDAGKLILWHGEPGTGKTHALRALARSWRAWCEIHYVMDPESFFGTPTSYMRDVLMNSDDYYEPYEERGHEDGQVGDDKWRLIVLEDTGELLGVDAKLDTGQGLSRLLNVVDGLLGQGLKLLVLITTNEPLAKMHPAVIRLAVVPPSSNLSAWPPQMRMVGSNRRDRLLGSARRPRLPSCTTSALAAAPWPPFGRSGSDERDSFSGPADVSPDGVRRRLRDQQEETLIGVV